MTVKIAPGIEIQPLTQHVPGKLHHAHCSGIVAFPDGELLVVFYWAIKEAQHEQKIFATRKRSGEAAWSKPEAILADRMGMVGNPSIWIAPDTGRLWLFFTRSIGGWSFCQPRFVHSDDKGNTWSKQRNLYWFVSRGIKNPPIVTKNGRYVLPAYVEFKYLRGVFFISADKGKSWKQSAFVDLRPDLIPAGYEAKKGRQVEQPTVIERRDGKLLALFRNDGKPMHKMLESTSADGGLTWTPAVNGILPNPAGGFHMLRLVSGNVAIAYNHAPSPGNDRKWRNPLSVALSEDDGATWSYRKNLLEWHPDVGGNTEQETFEYPTMTQGPDGRLHVTFSRSHVVSLDGVAQRVTDIQYTSFTEAWVKGRPFFEDAWESI